MRRVGLACGCAWILFNLHATALASVLAPTDGQAPHAFTDRVVSLPSTMFGGLLPDGSRIWTAGQHAISFWSTNGKLLESDPLPTQAHLTCATMTADFGHMWVGDDAGKIWERPFGQGTWTPHDLLPGQAILSLATAPEGQIVAAISDSGSILLSETKGATWAKA